MKNSIKIIICFIWIVFPNKFVNAQANSYKARVSVTFNKEGTLNYLKISGKYKEGKKYKPAEGLDFNVYQVFEDDSLVFLEDVILNKKGFANIDISKVFLNNLVEYDFKVIHKTSEKFKKISKSISVKAANLKAKLKIIDGNYFIEAKLTNSENQPIEDTELKVRLQRLFSPLAVGKGIYFTNENGLINVPITEIMPGIEGKLNYEIILEDNDDYGTIKEVIETNIGKPIVDQSTFDQRTMWSSPSKAPWFNLIIPNLLIIGVWGYLVILVFNLYRISKHKNT